jgi:hypothetical protein
MGVVDNWQVAGLQGTGSIDVMLDDVFVPDYRTQRLQDNFLLKGVRCIDPQETLATPGGD